MEPTSKGKSVEVKLETAWQSIDLAQAITERVAESAGFGEDDIHKIAMSVREGVINALHYGNRMQRDKSIHMIFTFEPKRLVIRMIDEGRGFEVEHLDNPLSEENLLRTSGRGLLIVQAFMDEMHVGYGSNGGAELMMAKDYPRRPGKAGEI
ncbi:MAG TPA: ATP-binding protein [Candidatus Dormibacteraeota bacterium]|nr:ATP-binding protein [Candidatus Dormibacteraeota bacterium]